MLSRVAECLYWMSRYVERAENLARIVDVNSALMLDLPYEESQRLEVDWTPVLASLGDDDGYADSDSDGNADGDAHGDSDGHADRDSDGDAHGDSDRDAHGDSDGHADRDPHGSFGQRADPGLRLGAGNAVADAGGQREPRRAHRRTRA